MAFPFGVPMLASLGAPLSPQPTITIRRAEKRDMPALGRLGGHLVRAHHAFDRARFMAPGPAVESGYGWFLGTQLRASDVAVFVAEQDGEVVGYVYAGVEKKSWMELRDVAGFVHDVVVDESARRTGVGSKLVEQAAEWLALRGVPRVMLWTAE